LVKEGPPKVRTFLLRGQEVSAPAGNKQVSA
jgi:hypothetical protein